MTNTSVSRRDFLRSTGIGALGLAGSVLDRPIRGASLDERVTRLSEHVMVYHGPINVGIIRDGDRAMLIDCGDGSVVDVLGQCGITSVEQILFTHHHRDQACGAHALAAAGARISVPAPERAHFDNVAAYWSSPGSRWHLYSFHPHHLMLAEPVGVDATVSEGQPVSWGPATIGVLATPGHTDGSVSYLVETDGKRIIFSGDCIYDEGQLWNVHSLQKGFQKNGAGVGDYHGFLGAREELAESLRRIKAAGPEGLIPSHGRIMHHPSKAIDLLLERLEVCYERYAAITGLRHWFGKLFAQYDDRKDHMRDWQGKPAPPFLRHIGTTWVIISDDKAAFVIDCGSPVVIRQLNELIAKGAIRTVEGLWVTHIHDDHVNAIPEFQKAFDCPCITDRHVADVITDPMAWRLPCISPSRARVDRATGDADSWPWREFKMTAYHFPGQTYYHSGLFVEGHGLRILFDGDALTNSGINDHCAQNRNWLGRGVGFDRCIELYEELRPTHSFNCHIDTATHYTPEQCRAMRANLAQREKLYGELLPWEHPNYGLDEAWVRCHPYEQQAAPGQEVLLAVVVTNHSSQARTATSRAVLPRAWGGSVTDWASTAVAAKSDGRIQLSLPVPHDAKPGRYVIPVDLHYDHWRLPQFTEAIVVVQQVR